MALLAALAEAKGDPDVKADPDVSGPSSDATLGHMERDGDVPVSHHVRFAEQEARVGRAEADAFCRHQAAARIPVDQTSPDDWPPLPPPQKPAPTPSARGIADAGKRPGACQATTAAPQGAKHKALGSPSPECRFSFRLRGPALT